MIIITISDFISVYFAFYFDTFVNLKYTSGYFRLLPVTSGKIVDFRLHFFIAKFRLKTSGYFRFTGSEFHFR